MNQRARNAYAIRNSWMAAARYWRALHEPKRAASAVRMARQWSHEYVRRLGSPL